MTLFIGHIIINSYLIILTDFYTVITTICLFIPAAMAELRCPHCKPKNLQEHLWMTFIDLQLRTQEIPHLPCTLPNIQAQIGSILIASTNLTERINNSHLLLSPSDYTTLHHKIYALQTNLKSKIISHQPHV
jgi:hypothetical protein